MQTEVTIATEVESLEIQTNQVVVPLYADMAARGLASDDTAMGRVLGPVLVAPVVIGVRV